MTVGQKATSPANRRGRRGPAGGFTLLELILVLVLISLTLAMAAPSLRNFTHSRRIADLAARLVVMTRWARSQAVSQGRICRLNVDVNGQACFLTVQHAGTFVPADGEWGKDLALPDGVVVVLRPGLDAPQEPYISFYPSGRCDPATLQVTGPDGETFVIACDSPTEPFRMLSEEEAAAR